MSEENKKRNTRKAARTAAIAVGSVVVACTAALAGFTLLYGDIHPGMRAGDIKIGGMSQKEAARAIDQSSAKLFTDGTSVRLSVGEKAYNVEIGAVTTGMDSQKTAQAAYDFTHEGSVFPRMGRVLTTIFGKGEVPLETAVDHEKLAARLDEISEEALTAPVDPSWKVEGDRLIIDRGEPGVDFDRNVVDDAVTERIAKMDFEPYVVDIITEPQKLVDSAAIAEDVNAVAKSATVDKTDGKTILPEQEGVEVDPVAIKTALDMQPGARTVEVEVKRTPAPVTAEELQKVLFRDTLATAKTGFGSSGASRANNVRLSSSFINGTILNPGDEFSYNDVVGERTSARGFKSAGAYVAGKLVDEVGGGVCQPSSTLYMAVLRADLKVTLRQNHGMTVAYTPLGEDATVSYGSIDFKFKNDTAYPVKILADSSGGTLRMSIVGTKTSDKTVSTDRKVLATYAPQTVEKPDASLYVGQTEIEQKPVTGYKVETYKIITENGKTTTVKANTSTYKKKDKIVRVGTKPVPANTAPSGGQPKDAGASSGVDTSGGSAPETPSAPAEMPPVANGNLDPE